MYGNTPEPGNVLTALSFSVTLFYLATRTKEWDYPPVMWYSDRPENDFETYVRTVADENGLSLEETISDTATHEAAHILAIDPAVSLAMDGPCQSWVTEGVAQYYGETRIHKNILRPIRTIPTVQNVALTEDGIPDYPQSLLLTLALAKKIGSDADEGVKMIVKKIVARAKDVINGKQARVGSPLALLYMIDPTLQEDDGSQALRVIMGLTLES